MALLEGSKRVATVQYCVLRGAPPTCIELAAKIESGQGGYLTYRVPKDWMYIFVQQSLSKCDKYRHSSHASRVSGEFSLSPAVAWQLQSTECREAGWSHLSPWAPLISTCASSALPSDKVQDLPVGQELPWHSSLHRIAALDMEMETDCATARKSALHSHQCKALDLDKQPGGCRCTPARV